MSPFGDRCSFHFSRYPTANQRKRLATSTSKTCDLLAWLTSTCRVSNARSFPGLTRIERLSRNSVTGPEHRYRARAKLPAVRPVRISLRRKYGEENRARQSERSPLEVAPHNSRDLGPSTALASTVDLSHNERKVASSGHHRKTILVAS